MQPRSDEELMQAYGGGDAAAFETLYERYRAQLYRYFLRQVGEAATVNDLYQGTWEKVIRARRQYKPQAPFRAWLFRIASNHLVDHYRRSRPDADQEPDTLPGGQPGPETAIDDDASRQRLRQAIRQLPDDQRDALMLKLEGGLSLEQIAEVTGVKMETAKSRLRYAVRKLREQLATTGEPV